MKDIIILGAGGNAIEIAETAQASLSNGASYRVMGFLDDAPQLRGRRIAGFPVLGGLETACRFHSAGFINGIGNPENFWQKPAIIARTGLGPERFITIVHPTAWVSPSAKLGRGVAVLAHASIGANVRIGQHVLVLPNAVVSHDDVIGDYTCIASSACVAGNVRIGESAYLGSGCAVRGHVHIGDRVLVGMGAVVLHDVPGNQVVVGNPARVLRPTVAAA